jgi:prephenate dehydrogenase
VTVGIVGLGLIGGSIGLSLRHARHTVLGFDTLAAHGQTAINRGCADSLASVEEVAQADVVFVSVPPLSVGPMLEALLPVKRPETVVTDCASVKSEVLKWVSEHAPGERRFVGGHPMAGHEKSGPAFASAWMFRNARWILTPAKNTDKDAIKLVEGLVKEMGATPVRIDPQVHDRHVAILSHLPHALAAILVEMGAELERADLVGGSWRDLTRVGGVDPELWSQIAIGNKVELSKVLQQAEGRLRELRVALEQEDDKAVRSFFDSARAAKGKHET